MGPVCKIQVGDNDLDYDLNDIRLKMSACWSNDLVDPRPLLACGTGSDTSEESQPV